MEKLYVENISNVKYPNLDVYSPENFKDKLYWNLKKWLYWLSNFKFCDYIEVECQIYKFCDFWSEFEFKLCDFWNEFEF